MTRRNSPPLLMFVVLLSGVAIGHRRPGPFVASRSLGSAVLSRPRRIENARRRPDQDGLPPTRTAVRTVPAINRSRLVARAVSRRSSIVAQKVGRNERGDRHYEETGSVIVRGEQGQLYVLTNNHVIEVELSQDQHLPC